MVCVKLWVLRVLGQGLKSECADIFHQSFLWLLCHTEEPQKGQKVTDVTQVTWVTRIT